MPQRHKWSFPSQTVRPPTLLPIYLQSRILEQHTLKRKVTSACCTAAASGKALDFVQIRMLGNQVMKTLTLRGGSLLTCQARCTCAACWESTPPRSGCPRLHELLPSSSHLSGRFAGVPREHCPRADIAPPCQAAHTTRHSICRSTAHVPCHSMSAGVTINCTGQAAVSPVSIHPGYALRRGILGWSCRS